MTRIPYVRREELGPEGQQLWDSIVNGRGDLVLTADGGLVLAENLIRPGRSSYRVTALVTLLVTALVTVTST